MIVSIYKKKLLLIFVLIVLEKSSAQISGIAYKNYNASGTIDNTPSSFIELLTQGAHFICSATTTADFRINNSYNYSQFNSMLNRMQNYTSQVSNNEATSIDCTTQGVSIGATSAITATGTASNQIITNNAAAYQKVEKIVIGEICIDVDSLLKEILKTGKTDKVKALQLFDKLPPVDIDFLLGIWRGTSVYTGHKLDGLLEVCGWYGKYFKSTEDVYPLVMYGRKTKLWSLNPKNIPLNVKLPKSKTLGILIKLIKPLLQTKKSKARLRMVEYRDKITATMIYDNKAIHDHFVKIDENTVLGCMDRKQDGSPFFWIMKRDKMENYSLKLKHP